MNDSPNTSLTDKDKPEAPNLSVDELLTTEYGYIAQSAFQANEDRARVSTYYVVTFGTLVASLFSLQINGGVNRQLYLALIVVFATLTLFGLSILLQLVRLRQAWTESVQALNQIKSFYIEQLRPLPLEEALRWKTATIPAAYKPWSVAFLLALQVALLAGVSLGATVYFLMLTLIAADSNDVNSAWIAAIAAGSLYAFFQIWLYRYLLKR